ncbi:MAG: hypothetical protein M3065_01675 [Actinomycetota bacterium]|nr:hypothetical protein [Actinomycetota bacterium]
MSPSTSAAAPGTTVTVTGAGFTPGSGSQVQIWLGSSPESVVALAAAPIDQAGSFSADVTIPDVAPGVTVMGASEMNAGGASTGQIARHEFTVLAPPPPPPVVPTPTAVAPSIPPDSTPPPAVVPPVVAVVSQPNAKLKLKAAIAACNSKYNVKKATTRHAKRVMTRRRTTCIARAHATAKASEISTHSVDVSLMSETSSPSFIATFVR